MTVFTLEYRLPSYTVADAFRPDPMWGRRVYLIDTSDIQTNDPAEVERLAIETAPAGYLFHSLRTVGSGA